MHFAQSAIPNRKERKGKEESGGVYGSRTRLGRSQPVAIHYCGRCLPEQPTPHIGRALKRARQNSFDKGQAIGITLFNLIAVVVDSEVIVECFNPRLAVFLFFISQWVFFHECLELFPAEPLRRP